MISLDDVFTALENAYTWTLDRVCGHFTSVWEILVNTWYSENNPVRGFSFDFVQKWQLDRHWDGIRKNYQPLLAAFVYAFVVLLMVKGIWYCVCYLCRGKTSRYGGQKVTEEARRWFIQAELDHQSSRNDMASETPAYEWVCFKCHQAAEKAVKAALISHQHTRNLSSPVRDLHALSEPLHDAILSELVGTLQHVIGITSHMSYPNTKHYPKVPHEVYRQQEANNAWHITSDIINHVYKTYLE